jgi:glycosyltransferase involved in cell wall biosynthesis
MAGKMVLCVSPAPIDGYPPMQNQAVLLANSGLQVLVLTSALGEKGHGEFCQPNVRCFWFPLQSRSWPRRQWGRVRLAARLIYCRLRFRREIAGEIAYDPDGIFFVRALPFRSRKVVAHLHEVLFNPRGSRIEKYSVRTLKDFSFVVTADERRASLLQSQVGDFLKIIVARNMPLLTTANGRFPNAAEVERPFSVVYHGVISDVQAIDSIIASMPAWPPDVTFHIYGKPDVQTRTKLERLAERKGISSRVRFEGWLSPPALIERLQNHSVGMSLLRPINDNWRYSLGASNKRYQYMQAGLPQISDNGEDIVGFIEGKKIGFCAPPDDPAAIAEKVCFFYERQATAKEFGRRARELYETEFHYEKDFAPILKFMLE